jgi:mono/diheme cytochrome c family protein
MRRSFAFARGLLAVTAFAAMAPVAAVAASPQSLYMDNCSACHQATGKGVKGAFPALAGSPLVQGDGKVVAATVLAGRAGMPAFKDDLSDADLSALLTYVRSSWGNKGKPLTVADVAAARVKLNAAKKPRNLQAH